MTAILHQVASVALFGLLAIVAATPAEAQRARTVAEGTNIDWSPGHGPNPARYRVGDVELTLRGRPEPDASDLIVPVLTVQMPGYAPVETQGTAATEGFEHRVAVGRWDTARPFVLFQTYSGGAHCCTEMQLVYPEDGRLRLVNLGEWDGGPLDELPTDRNGDGRIDFVFVDNAFLYAFASYAESWAPPIIYNIVNGEAVNVSFPFSRDPGFRPLYEEAMARERQACVHPEDGATPNGACAAYVASAARAGRFDAAWAEMLQAYDRDFDWPLPGGCRVALIDLQCPEGQAIEYDNYPDALRAFLLEQGYLVRSRAVRLQ
jgi:hypothetical protein